MFRQSLQLRGHKGREKLASRGPRRVRLCERQRLRAARPTGEQPDTVAPGALGPPTRQLGRTLRAAAVGRLLPRWPDESRAARQGNFSFFVWFFGSLWGWGVV